MQRSMDTPPSSNGHVVQFYDDWRALTRVAVDYLGGALLDGDAAVAITAVSHQAEIRAGLASLGVDLDSVLGDGRLVFLDAEVAIPDSKTAAASSASSFEAVLGSTIRGLAAARPVRAIGEMAWMTNDQAGVIALERHWNELAETVPFSLLCAYPSWTMDGDDSIAAFSEICAAHGAVVAGAPTPSGAELSATFPRGRLAPSHARRFVAAALRSWGLDELVEAGMLVVAELASNAIVHTHSGFTVSLSRCEASVRIIVGDLECAVPEPRTRDALAESGRGLHLVDVVASTWGHDAAVPTGKFVWADLAVRSPRSADAVDVARCT
jgi:anti-sigma regulatory factor (Ser/Thr protein kinase)